MNCCSYLYDDAIAVVYFDAECFDMQTERLLMRNMLESMAKFERKMCSGKILNMLAEHSYFWNWVQL